jgi:enoyl-CoA hydratase/carnithine racemase
VNAASAPGGRRRHAPVELVVHDRVAWLTLARPATGNRLDAELLGGLAEACATVEAADDIHVVVLAARGPAFSLGLPAGCAWPEASWPDGVGAVAALRRPVLAVLDGEARGWGAALALACDLRFASRRAVLTFPEVRAGQLPGGGVTQRLARIAGPARALDLLLLRHRIAAPEAAAWGLVTTVVPAARLQVRVGAAARALAERGPLALRLAKEAVSRALDLPLDDGVRLEHDLYVLLQTTTDRHEGVRAFLERRKPRFHAR